MVRAEGTLTVRFHILLESEDISENSMTMSESDKLIIDTINKLLEENNVEEIYAIGDVFVENHDTMASYD